MTAYSVNAAPLDEAAGKPRWRLLKSRLMVAALIIGLGVSVYFAILGFRYVNVSIQAGVSKEKIGKLEDSLREAPPDIVGLKAERDSHAREMEELRALFSHGDVSELMALISKTSRETSVGLRSIAVGGSQAGAAEGVEYRLQAMMITVIGATDDMAGFFSALHTELPIFSITDLSITNPGSGSSGQARLLFYILPEKPLKAEGAT